MCTHIVVIKVVCWPQTKVTGSSRKSTYRLLSFTPTITTYWYSNTTEQQGII